MRRNKTARTPSHQLYSEAPPTQAKGYNRMGSGDCIPPTNPPLPADKPYLILHETHQSQADFEHHIDTTATDLSILKDDHKKLADKVRAAEGTLTELAPQHTLNTNTISDLRCRIQQLHDRTEDAGG
ncbi:hypothetical protein NDU88_004314 [Pleurodeles waltl]|uniref:Uncharacterized protein n=1 Tax=Pleurodeles waltl TaxID=8319 RepID=A0AAV7TTR4_PLEWA|nr:hypothetical protein NDU88_004314 [Pleurodeles waltl]